MDNDDGNTDNVDVIITITVISIITSLSYCKKLVFLGRVRSLIYIHVEHGNNSWSLDIVQPNFENFWPISYYDWTQ